MGHQKNYSFRQEALLSGAIVTAAALGTSAWMIHEFRSDHQGTVQKTVSKKVANTLEGKEGPANEEKDDDEVVQDQNELPGSASTETPKAENTVVATEIIPLELPDLPDFDIYCALNPDKCVEQDGRILPGEILRDTFGINPPFSILEKFKDELYQKLRMPPPPPRKEKKVTPPTATLPDLTPVDTSQRSETPDITPYYTDKFSKMFDTVLNGDERICNDDAQWMMWMLQSARNDPRYMFMLRSSINVRCTDFVGGVENLANDYEDDMDDKESWKSQLAYLGFAKNKYGAWVWIDRPSTLACR